MPDKTRRAPGAQALTRRTFLRGTSALLTSSALAPAWAREASPEGSAKPAPRRPRVAAINSVYRLKSHAYHIAGRFIFGYTREGVHHQPPFQLARMFNDQYPSTDMSRDVGSRHGVEVSKTVEEALCGERKTLDVDAVLLIIEHGDYPLNELGQTLYPRYEYFQRIAEVVRRSERGVPIFVDKHLSYDHQQAHAMVRTARRLGCGLMAGSSLPVTWRRPELEPALETPFREGLVAFGYDRGPAEIYLFHALEALQCMWERRAGGETGVRRVRALKGPAVWRAGDDGLWSWELLRAAFGRSPSLNYGNVKENVKEPIAILIEYHDGTRAAVLDFPEHVSDFNFAGRVAGSSKVLSTNFFLPPPPGARFFDPLVAGIEQFFASGSPPYPVERTLLTSTVLDLAMHSLHDGGTGRESPLLDTRYAAPRDSAFFRGRTTDAREGI